MLTSGTLLMINHVLDISVSDTAAIRAIKAATMMFLATALGNMIFNTVRMAVRFVDDGSIYGDEPLLAGAAGTLFCSGL